MGRTKQRLAVMLTDALNAAGYSVAPIQGSDLSEAKGWYRTSGHLNNEALRWEADVTRADLPKLSYWLTSYETMTNLVRNGISIGVRDGSQIWIDSA